MRGLSITVALGAWGFTTWAHAADVHRTISAEIDPVAPASAKYEENLYGTTTSKWGGQVDFNVGGVISTGPEFWTGAFVVKGDDEDAEGIRREDFWPGERHKIDGTRLRWMFTRWKRPMSMRGWYLKAGYSYTRINSRANRYTEQPGDGDAVPISVPFFPSDSPDDETDLITDIRHGAVFGFGQRWAFANQSLIVTLGTSFTGYFKRSVTVDSKDPDAREDYDDLIEDLPDTRLSVRPTPEANLNVGYAW